MLSVLCEATCEKMLVAISCKSFLRLAGELPIRLLTNKLPQALTELTGLVGLTEPRTKSASCHANRAEAGLDIGTD